MASAADVLQNENRATQKMKNSILTFVRMVHLQFLYKLLKIALGGLFVKDLKHFSSNISDLASLGVASGLLVLVLLLLCESNSENSKNIPISCANSYECLDE